jgi:hypothetical protein
VRTEVFSTFEQQLMVLPDLYRIIIIQLYDHRGELLQDFTHLETINLVFKPGYDTVVRTLRQYLVEFIKKKIVFRGPFVGR